jgi:PQQ-like domain
MLGRTAVAVTVVLGLVAALVDAVPAVDRAAKCTIGSRPAPGGGALEWQPDRERQLVVRGWVGAPTVRVGNTLIATTSSRDLRRYGLAAFDLRTRRRLAFEPRLPPGNIPLALAASAATVYVVYGSDGAIGPKGVRAFNLRTGAALRGFRVTDFDEEGTVFSGIAYARSRVVLAGGPGTGPGGVLAAYNPTTGAEVWRTDPGWTPQGLVTDGARLFLGVPKLAADQHMVVAYDAGNGKPVPGWGVAIEDDFDTEAKGIAGPNVVVWKTSVARTHTFLYSRAVGKPVATPRTVAAGGDYLYGTGRTIVGLVKDRGQPAFSVYDASGKVIGTVCFRYVVLAQRDDRTLIAAEGVAGGDSRLLWLRRG